MELLSDAEAGPQPTQTSRIMRPSTPLVEEPVSPTREGAFQSPPPPRPAAVPKPRSAQKYAPPPPSSDLDAIPLTITALEDPRALHGELRQQIYPEDGSEGEGEGGEDEREDGPTDFQFVPALRTDGAGQLCFRAWGWAEGAEAEAPLALVARRRANDPWFPSAVVAVLPIAVRRFLIGGEWQWVGQLGQPAVDTTPDNLPAESRPAVRRRLIEAAAHRLRGAEDPVGAQLTWLIHRPRHGNPDALQTAAEIVAQREAATGRPIPDGELKLGWERLHPRQLQIELPLPLPPASGGVPGALRRLQPVGTSAALSESLLPPSLDIRPLPLALPAGGAGWASRWGCGIERAEQGWREVWRRATAARVAYSAECAIDGVVERTHAAGWPAAAAAAGAFGRLDKARIEGWAAVAPADRSRTHSLPPRAPIGADGIPHVHDSRASDANGHGAGWPAFPRAGAVAIHIPSGAVGEVYKIYLPPPPEGATDEEEEAAQRVSCLATGDFPRLPQGCCGSWLIGSRLWAGT